MQTKTIQMTIIPCWFEKRTELGRKQTDVKPKWVVYSSGNMRSTAKGTVAVKNDFVEINAVETFKFEEFAPIALLGSLKCSHHISHALYEFMVVNNKSAPHMHSLQWKE